jgi:NarL family two-component system response regulator LiaR
MMAEDCIRVFLVDDHHVVRRGMRSFLESFSDLRVVGEAATAEDALRALQDCGVDVVVMDVLLPGGMDGISATNLIRQRFPSVRVVVLTAYTDEARAAAALRVGAIGYVRKDSRPEFLLEVIRAAHRGVKMVDPFLAAGQNGQELATRGEILSAREMDVLRRVARGRTNREIAEELFLGEETVKTHVASILGKLRLGNRGQAAAFAIRQGWINLEDE